MSEEQSLGRKWRSREAAEELVREFEASGLRRKQFCAERGLSTYTLDLYRKRFVGGGAERRVVGAGAAVAEQAAEERMQLVLSGGCGWK